ncbi:MAG: hypothetical protein JO115_18620 [Pseudonocardiales bacterium]|nr:hypothetical protein [Pseudonocardiales bacterium]
MSSAEVPDADALEQQIPVEETEGAIVNPTELPLEVNPADAVEQHRDLGGDDAEDYPPG